MSWIPDLPRPMNEGLTEALTRDYLGVAQGSYAGYVKMVQWTCEKNDIDARGLLHRLLRAEHDRATTNDRRLPSAKELSNNMITKYGIETGVDLYSILPPTSRYGSLLGILGFIALIDLAVILGITVIYNALKTIQPAITNRRFDRVLRLCRQGEIHKARREAKRHISAVNKLFPRLFSKIVHELTGGVLDCSEGNRRMYRVVNFAFTGDPDKMTEGDDNASFIEACHRWWQYENRSVSVSRKR
jgi:hypothetical protein